MTAHPRDFCLCAADRRPPAGTARIIAGAGAPLPLEGRGRGWRENNLSRTKLEAAVRAHIGRAADERLAYLHGDGRRTEAKVGDILEAMTIGELEQCLREPGPLAVRNLLDVLAEAADPGTVCRGRRTLPVRDRANGAAIMGAL